MKLLQFSTIGVMLVNKSDFSLQYSGLNNSLLFVTALTNEAQQNSEFESHVHYNEFEIYYFLEGDLYFSLEGKRYYVEEGSMIIITNGLLHKPIIKAPCRYFRKRILFDKKIFIDFNIFSFELYNILRKRKFITLSKEDVQAFQLDTLFSQIEHSLSHNSQYEDFCASISLFSLLIKAEKSSRQSDNSFIHKNNGKIDEIIRYIEEHLSENLSYKAISEKFFITEKNLYKIFKNQSGFTLSNYISERRIIKAQSILNSGYTANEAAILSGFNDYSVFYKNFLKKVGITPAGYIKNLTQSK